MEDQSNQPIDLPTGNFPTTGNDITQNQTPPNVFSPPPASRGNNLLKKRPVLPNTNRRPVDGNLPESPYGTAKTPKTKKPKKGGDSPSKLPDLGDKTANNKKQPDKEKPAKNPLDGKTAKTSDPVKDAPINKKPLFDLVDEILEKKDKNQIDLSQQSLVTMKGEINENGRLNTEKSRFVRAEGEGNKAMVNIAKRAIEAVGESGWLDYLSRLDVKKADITLAQNNEKLIVVVNSALSSPEKANQVASGLRFLKNSGLKKNLKPDEQALLKSAKVTSKGNLLVINFDMDKAAAQKMIAARLDEYRAKKIAEKNKTQPKSSKPNGTAKKTDANGKLAK